MSQDNQNEDNQSETRWKKLHIDPTISIGHIITTITIAVSAIWWASTVETRIANHDVKIKHIEDADVKLERTRAEERREWKDELREIKQELRELNTRIGNGGYLPPTAGRRDIR